MLNSSSFLIAGLFRIRCYLSLDRGLNYGPHNGGNAGEIRRSYVSYEVKPRCMINWKFEEELRFCCLLIFSLSRSNLYYFRFVSRYYRMVTKRRICLCIGVVWLFSIFWVTIQLCWLNFTDHSLGRGGLSEDEIRSERIYNITGVFLCFTIPLCVMVFCFGKMFAVIRRQVRNIRRQAELSVDPRNRSIASDKRALFIFAMMLGVFTICWLSWYINLFQVELDEKILLPVTVADVLDFFRFGTSLFNPLMYTFLKNDFRRASCSLVAKCCVKQSIFKPKHDLNATGTTLTTDTNGNKSTALLSDCSPTYDQDSLRKESQDNSVKEAEDLQLITHV